MSVRDIYPEFLAGFWGYMEDQVQADIQAVPAETKTADVQSRFGIDHWCRLLQNPNFKTEI